MMIGARDIKDALVWMRDEFQERRIRVPVTSKSLVLKRRPNSADVITPAGNVRSIVGKDCSCKINLDTGKPPYFKCNEGGLVENMSNAEIIDFMKGQMKKKKLIYSKIKE